MNKRVTGSGLGLRRSLTEDLKCLAPTQCPAFLEIAPENWLQANRSEQKELHFFSEHYPMTAHGLSLNLGGRKPLDINFIHRIKKFLHQYRISFYSDHLTYCADNGHLYDLFPLPFTEESVKHVAHRIKQVQDILEQPIAIENASYYYSLPSELSEAEFINAVLRESGCHLMLDINNVFVNSVNNCYDPVEFLHQMPPSLITYLHIAGHCREAPDLIIDTHSETVCTDVWDLLQAAYTGFGVLPTLLERDFNIPALAELLPELHRIREIQASLTRTPSPLFMPHRSPATITKNSTATNPNDFCSSLTQLIRHPQSASAHYQLPARAELYRGFVHDNFDDILKRTFPVIHSLTQETHWETWRQQFIQHYFCQNPLCNSIPEEFLQFLKHQSIPENLPFLHELAHYEWIELGLDLETQPEDNPALDATKNFNDGIPVISPQAILLHYQYPVRKICKEYLPSVPDPIFLIAYRNKEQRITFMDLNPAGAKLFYLLEQQSHLTGPAAAQQIAVEIKHPKPEVVLAGAQALLQQFYELGIVLGYQCSSKIA